MHHQGSNEELLDGLEVCGLGGRKTKEGDGNGKKPGPFPEKRLKQDKLDFLSQKVHSPHFTEKSTLGTKSSSSSRTKMSSLSRMSGESFVSIRKRR